MVITITPTRRTISMSAGPGRRSPKKMNDHAAFSASWAKNNPRASDTSVADRCRHTSHAAVAISKYKVDQTGAKTHDGGVPRGFSRVGYHVLTEDAVNLEPMTPAPKQMVTKPSQPIQ